MPSSRRSTARHALNQPQHYLLVNFSRATLSDDNTGGGHFSPLAALRSSEAVRSSRVIDTAFPIDAAPLKSRIESEFR